MGIFSANRVHKTSNDGSHDGNRNVLPGLVNKSVEYSNPPFAGPEYHLVNVCAFTCFFSIRFHSISGHCKLVEEITTLQSKPMKHLVNLYRSNRLVAVLLDGIALIVCSLALIFTLTIIAVACAL
jgi:hypothetical protein